MTDNGFEVIEVHVPKDLVDWIEGGVGDPGEETVMNLGRRVLRQLEVSPCPVEPGMVFEYRSPARGRSMRYAIVEVTPDRKGLILEARRSNGSRKFGEQWPTEMAKLVGDLRRGVCWPIDADGNRIECEGSEATEVGKILTSSVA